MIPIKDTVPHRESPFVNYFLIFLNILVFVFETMLPDPYLNFLIHKYGLVPARYTSKVWSTLTGLPSWDLSPFLTNMFLHGSWIHLISNVWALWIFGDNVEDRLGHFRYFIFYIVCGVLANLTHLLTNINSTIPVVGASGAISGVMAAYLIMFPFSRIITLIPIFFIPFFFEIPAVFYIGAWFISQLFSGFLTLLMPDQWSSIAWWAHIGGFVSGVVLLPFFKKKDYRSFYPDEIYFHFH